MSRGIRTSVKGYLIAQRLSLVTNPISENVTIINNITATPDPPLQTVEEIPVDSATNGHGICDGSIPCFPFRSYTAKNMAPNRTRSVESRPYQDAETWDGWESFILNSFRCNELKLATRNLQPDTFLSEANSSSVYKGRIDEDDFESELKLGATNLRPDTFPSEASSGSFYQGLMDEGQLRAARAGGMDLEINFLDEENALQRCQSPEEWMAEVDWLGKLVHPNIVKQIGYLPGSDTNSRLLVTECMSKGRLKRHLFNEVLQPLSWILRMKIAVGAAKGLAFLRSDEAKLIYGNFDTSKILLDSDYNAKLYGYRASQRHDGYRYGTYAFDHAYEAPWYVPPGFEYVAPELKSWKQCAATPKSDVFSFGVVFLEILCNRKAIHISRGNLVHMACQEGSKENEIQQIMDTEMEGQYNAGAVKGFDLAIHCLEMKPEKRPDMTQVVEILEELVGGISDISE